MAQPDSPGDGATPSGGASPSPALRRRLAVALIGVAALVAAGTVLAQGATVTIYADPPRALTAEQYQYCQGHYWDGMGAAQENRGSPADWFFNHYGSPDNADTVRDCLAAWSRR